MEETLLTVIITVVALTILACQQTLISPRRPSKRRRYDTTLLALIPSSQPAAMHALAAAALHTSGPGSVSGWYQRPRSGHFWQVEVLQHWDDNEFRRHFRVSRSFFALLSQSLDPLIGKKDTNYKPAIETQRRLAVFLDFLAHGGSYRQVGERYNMGKSTVAEAIEQVALALCEVWLGTIKFPSDPARIRQIERGFRMGYGVPGAVGATDGMHVPIQKPQVGGDDYYNRKQFASLTGQFTADADYRCLDLLWGYPGSVHDSRMFRNSSLKKRIVSGDIPLLSMPPIQLADDSIPYYLLADSGYSNTAYLLTPFDHRSDLSPEQRVYNKQLSSAHMVVKLMVGMVKARWGLLLAPMRTSVGLSTVLVFCAIILHNLCLDFGQQLDMDWWQAYEQRQRGPKDEPEQQQVGRELSPADEDGSNLRATMVSYTNRRH